MNENRPKPLERQKCMTNLDASTIPVPDKSSKISPEEGSEPKIDLADLINDTLEEKGLAGAKEDRPAMAMPLTQPAIPLGIHGGQGEEAELSPQDQLRLAAWMVAGVILDNRLRFMDKDLLGVMRVSKSLKGFALETPHMNLDGEVGPKTNIDPATVKQRIRELRDGLYLVLRLENAMIFVLGGKKAEIVDEKTVELTFKGIPNARGFFKVSDDIENGWSWTDAPKAK